MKYKELVRFIKNYYTSKHIEKALDAALGVQINKERLDLYEKLKIYCPELTEKSLKYIDERMAKNRDLLAKREKLIEEFGMHLEHEQEEDVPVELDNFLDGRENNNREYGRLNVDTGIFTIPEDRTVTWTTTAMQATEQLRDDAVVPARDDWTTGLAARETNEQREMRRIQERTHEEHLRVAREAMQRHAEATLRGTNPWAGGLNTMPEPDFTRGMTGTRATLEHTAALDRQDEEIVRHYSNQIREGRILVNRGEYGVGLTRGRIAYLNDNGLLVRVD